MASVPNRVYPFSEHGEVRTNVLRVQKNQATGTSGSIIIGGFLAQGAIRQYQPVFFSTTGTYGCYVSGASAIAQGGLLGCAANAAIDGASVDVINQGLVPQIVSGAVAVTLGGPIMVVLSGSVNCVHNFSTSLATTGSYCVLGHAAITGSAAHAATVHVWVTPGFF